ncbi:Uncharacterized protein Nst1_295 [Candidatus Nanobsidianus stetteri]|uniref:Uncharacterized protein n=1 Tax=Nanobsidianus stetteri TaxID=1294122 RepID=R1FTZ9_NANST|nr:Uncharacterized protein Nst1_295 [Candidatus Nanobsidianus stetteri]
MYSHHFDVDGKDKKISSDEIIKWDHTILEGDVIESEGYEKISLKEIVKWKLQRRKIKSNGYKKKSDGYKKISSLDEILSIAKGNDGELKFMFARQIAPFNIETILALLDIEGAIKKADEYGYKVNKVILDILQWKDNKFSFSNIEKKIFVEPQMLYSKLQYNIAVESKRKIRIGKYRIGDVYLDVIKIIKMIYEIGFEYMEKALNHLENERKVKDDSVNILDFWGLATLYYIGEISKDIFGIDKYEIKEFKDKIKLANGDEFDISGYELTFKYNGKELKFRVYDASHIYKEESEKYKTETNLYITLALLSGSRYILLEEDPGKEDNKIKHFYREAKKKTGYDILLFELDEQKLIERGIIGKDDYVKLIHKNKIKKIINIIKEIYGL